MSRMGTFAIRATLAAMTMLTMGTGTMMAQSPVPTSAPTPLPTPTPDTGIVWPPMRFVGSDPAGQLTFTSTCGVWGQDAIELHGEGSAGSTDLTVVLETYDPEAAQWLGSVSGSYTGPEGVTVSVGPEGALVYYEFDLGQWRLVASWAAQIPAEGCTQPSPSPSGAP